MRDAAPLTINDVEAICAALGVQVMDLISETAQRNSPPVSAEVLQAFQHPDGPRQCTGPLTPDGRMDAVATTRRDAAPNPEWVLMYRGGLSRNKIAALAGAPAGTVGYHLRVACAADPGLREAHEEAAGTGASRVTAQGRERMRQLVAMVQAGHYPSRNAESTSERTLATWLQRRREDARAGTLAPAFRDGLAVLPGWEGTPRAEADEARWQERLTALIAYRAAGNDWPRHKASITGEEHELGVWLHSQRFKVRRGELDAGRLEALDSAVTGWRVGRKRGRVPTTRS